MKILDVAIAIAAIDEDEKSNLNCKGIWFILFFICIVLLGIYTYFL